MTSVDEDDVGHRRLSGRHCGKPSSRQIAMGSEAGTPWSSASFRFLSFLMYRDLDPEKTGQPTEGWICIPRSRDLLQERIRKLPNRSLGTTARLTRIILPVAMSHVIDGADSRKPSAIEESSAWSPSGHQGAAGVPAKSQDDHEHHCGLRLHRAVPYCSFAGENGRARRRAPPSQGRGVCPSLCLGASLEQGKQAISARGIESVPRSASAPAPRGRSYFVCND